MIHLGEEIQHLLFYVAHIHLADTMVKGFAGFPYPNYLVAHSIELDSLQLLHQTVSPSCFSKKEKKKKIQKVNDSLLLIFCPKLSVETQ